MEIGDQRDHDFFIGLTAGHPTVSCNRKIASARACSVVKRRGSIAKHGASTVAEWREFRPASILSTQRSLAPIELESVALNTADDGAPKIVAPPAR
jgi:hypothetical protein